MNLKTKRRFIWTAGIGFLFWILGSYLFHYHLNVNIGEGGISDFEAAYQEKSTELYKELNQFSSRFPSQKTVDARFALAQKLEKETGFSFYSFNGDTLDLWSSNRIAVPHPSDSYWEHNEIVLLQNGWYKLATYRDEERLFVAAFLVKNEYYYENEDLVNEFSPELAPNLSGDISFSEKGFPVHNINGEHIFSIIPSDETEKNLTLELIVFSLYLVGFLILLQLLINAFQRLLITKPILLILFPLGIVLLRYLWLTSEFTGLFSDFELFNPELFASSNLAPSLGDLIINISIFYFIVHFLLKRTRNWFATGNLKLKLVVFVVPLFLSSFYIAFQINEIIHSLVYNSKIPFDLERLFDLNQYTFVSIALIGASFYAYFKLVQYIIIQLKASKFEWNKLAFMWVISSGVYIVTDQYYFDQSLLTSLWPIFLSGSLLWFHFTESDYKFAHVISMLAFIAFYASYILQGYSADKEREIRKFQADKIAKDRDPLTEIDFAELAKKMEADEFLAPYFIGNFDHSIFSETIEERYFDRLKDKFQFKFFLFDSNEKLLYDPRNYDLKSFERFEEIIKTSGISTAASPDLYFINNYTDKLNYLSKIDIIHKDSLYGHLFTEFRSTKFPDEIGLPSLLLDDRTANINHLKNYSIAKYVNNNLVTRRGDYNYPTSAFYWVNKVGTFTEKGNYNHFVYLSEEGDYTVVSKESSTGIALFTSFSYLLIIFGVLLLIPLIYVQLQRKVNFNNIKLNVKIQAVLISLIFITLVAFAVGAGAYVADINLETNKDLLKEKIGAVKIEIEDRLKQEEEVDETEAEYLEFLLTKFSRVFVTDINIFDHKGDLLASSQPKIYSQGLVSKKMNTSAYRGIYLNNQSEYIHKERIGKLEYLSGYRPIYNDQGNFLAFLNVQYISRQQEMENQISGFLLAIINIMVFMLAFSTILSITVSNRLIRPLKYIQESIKNVQIGSGSQSIAYHRTDEIGDLVKEYNKKVDELQKNAEMLAKSERESAWREMAKQVAHEIKNPLTPMKLSIQHLSRSVQLANEESEEKLQRVTKSLIEQIDALTTIANEFSNFAKMPKPSETEVDLTEILQSTISVFAEYDQHQINLHIEPKTPTLVWADKDLLLRVFNNLTKNAIQAIPVGEQGLISVTLTESENYYKIEVKDNGVGIKQTEKERIFVPYFTTKSKGTGLGLAMSKQIVESMQGKIWFESEINVGTSFFINFPKLNH
ncbi:sensor histidine kinase [Crocinitomix algicola]|uniref:sensor histidine kinase n=1 Tax=Crocinitomix algicola TaxID=1740263 RepID=UPI0008726CED|nr:HAMP domain-containing sensor histidine kinase [Crocinitomix algicola]